MNFRDYLVPNEIWVWFEHDDWVECMAYFKVLHLDCLDILSKNM